MEPNTKQYNYMEPTFQKLQKLFITPNEEEVARNNKILKALLDELLTKTKQVSPLFKELYTSIFYGGSFYDRLRVHTPDEFDLDLLLVLPRALGAELIVSNKPGFMHCKLNKWDAFQKQAPLMKQFPGLAQFISKNNLLITQNVKSWMISIMTKTLNQFSGSIIPITVDGRKINLKVGTTSSGPAFTLLVQTPHGQIDIDLVPCFVFQEEQWPKQGYRTSPAGCPSRFFIVPKQISGPVDGQRDTYWRLSFQEQERFIMNQKDRLKPTIKLLKKLRDKLDHKVISSYFIKTIVLWIDLEVPKSFWQEPLSYVFMMCLKKYAEFIKSTKISYYWNQKFNLLSEVNKITLTNFGNNLQGMIADIERNKDDPELAAKYVLNASEFAKLKRYKQGWISSTSTIEEPNSCLLQ